MKGDYASVSGGRDLPTTWEELREGARAHFEKQGFPSPKNEAWKYTDLRHVTSDLLAHAKGSNDSKVTLPEMIVPKSYRLVLIDGRVSNAMSVLPKGNALTRISTERGEIAPSYRQLVDKAALFAAQPHVALNTSRCRGAILLSLPPGSDLGKPIEVCHYTTQEARGGIYTQLWLLLGEGSRLTLLEHFCGKGAIAAGDPKTLHNHLVYGQVGKGVAMKHYTLQEAPLNSCHLYSSYLDLSDESHYESFSAKQGGQISRCENHVELCGKGIRCQQRGVKLGRGRQRHDDYLPVIHRAPESFSQQHFCQLLDEESRAVFYGSVRVPQGSVKTEAHQLNRNLLLSEGAQVYTRPELLIHTDDVICSHGATVGNLDQMALYYLMTRGLCEKEARTILIRAFAEEVLWEIGDELIRPLLQKRIAAWIP